MFNVYLYIYFFVIVSAKLSFSEFLLYRNPIFYCTLDAINELQYVIVDLQCKLSITIHELTLIFF